MLRTKIVVLICLLVALAGCSEARGLKNIQEYYEVEEVVAIPDSKGHYIARKDDGSIWYAFSSGWSENFP